jgi:hypothetical protein
LVPSKFSREVEVVSPIDAPLLIVSTRGKAQSDRRPVPDKRNGNQKASIEFEVVGGNAIHLLRRVAAPDEALSTSSSALATDYEDASSPGSPFALNSYKFVTRREDHVEAHALRNWTVDLDTELRRSQLDR